MCLFQVFLSQHSLKVKHPAKFRWLCYIYCRKKKIGCLQTGWGNSCYMRSLFWYHGSLQLQYSGPPLKNVLYIADTPLYRTKCCGPDWSCITRNTLQLSESLQRTLESAVSVFRENDFVFVTSSDLAMGRSLKRIRPEVVHKFWGAMLTLALIYPASTGTVHNGSGRHLRLGRGETNNSCACGGVGVCSPKEN